MPKYRVHMYPIVRVAVEVEAESPKAAMEKAYGETDFYAMFPASDNFGYAEADDGAVVDLMGESFAGSAHFNSAGERA